MYSQTVGRIPTEYLTNMNHPFHHLANPINAAKELRVTRTGTL